MEPNDAKPPAPGRIGEILVRCGWVTPDQLDRALKLAREDSLRLGEALVRLGVLDEDKITWALGVQFDLSFVDVDEQMIDWDFLRGLPLARLRELLLLPMSRNEEVVRAVIADPAAPGLTAAVESIFQGQRVIMQLASQRDIVRMLLRAQIGIKTSAPAREPAAPASPPPPEAGPIQEFLAHIEAGEWERVTILPAEQDEVEYHAWPSPYADPEPLFLTAADIDAFGEGRLGAEWIAVENYGCGYCVVRPGHRPSGRRAVRACWVRGLAGRLTLIEGIPWAPPEDAPAAPIRPILLTGENPLQVKAAFLLDARRREFAELGILMEGPAISFEAHVDFMADGWFQVEWGDAQDRIKACRRFLTGARPALTLLELDTEQDLARLSFDCAGQNIGPFLIVIRRPSLRGPKDLAPPGMRMFAMPSAPATRRTQILALLEKG